MHLIITALDKNFNDNEECLLLGNWCLKGEGTIDKSKYNIVPYHWKDLVKAENDSSYLYDVYKRVMMPELSIIMNKLHRVDHSERYWMVLLGPWLWHFICTLYDRYLSIITADRLYSNLETNTVDQMFCPVTYSEWYQLITSDKYNLIIFSDILKHTNNSILCDTEYKGARVYSSVRHKKGNNLDLSIISFLKKIKYLAYLKINSIRRIAAKLRNKIVVDLGVQISRQERKDLFSKLGQIFVEDIFYSKGNEAKLNDFCMTTPCKTKRNLKIDKETKDDFIRLTFDIIFQHIPMEYVENYDRIESVVTSNMPATLPKVALLNGTFSSRAYDRFSIAELNENGVKTLATQEGGIGSLSLHRDHDKVLMGVSDIYLTWGQVCNKASTLDVRPFYLTKTFWRLGYKYNTKGHIILIAGSCRRYFVSFGSGQLPSYNDTLINYNIRFLKALNKDVYSNLIYRFHWQYGYNEIGKTLLEFPDLKISRREDDSHFYELLNNSKLAIATVDYTTMKQTMLSNHPTLLLWDSDYFIIRDKAKKYYDLLHEVGILHYSPESCANKVNDIHRDPLIWWMSREVQIARKKYCEGFCRISNNISEDLFNVISSL